MLSIYPQEINSEQDGQITEISTEKITLIIWTHERYRVNEMCRSQTYSYFKKDSNLIVPPCKVATTLRIKKP